MTKVAKFENGRVELVADGEEGISSNVFFGNTRNVLRIVLLSEKVGSTIQNNIIQQMGTPDRAVLRRIKKASVILES